MMMISQKQDGQGVTILDVGDGITIGVQDTPESLERKPSSFAPTVQLLSNYVTDKMCAVSICPAAGS